MKIKFLVQEHKTMTPPIIRNEMFMTRVLDLFYFVSLVGSSMRE